MILCKEVRLFINSFVRLAKIDPTAGSVSAYRDVMR